LTKFISYYARRSNLLAVFFLVFGTSIFMIPTANAAYGNTTVICATNNGNQQSFGIGWDNSNKFFADRGYIPRLFCEGGYAGNYRTYISDTLNGSALGYFAGLIPTPSNPTPSETSPSPTPTETATATPEPTPSETVTATPSPSSTPAPEPSPSATPEPSPSASSVPETQTSQVETPTATETSTTPSVSPVDGSTATSQPQSQPEPTPPAPPMVEPDPVEEPAVVPEEEPLPEPETPEEVTPEEAPKPITDPIVDEVEESPQVETTVTLDNGVVLTQEQAVAIALLQNPGELLQELFTNPGAALAALGQVGADMSPEVRDKSEKVVISAVIAGNIATQAAATAGAVAAYRRKQ